MDYVLGDMRELPWSEPRFDAVILWFTAFGYFDDATNAEVLHAIRRVLRPAGGLAMDFNHLPRILANFNRQQWLRRDSNVALDEHDWDPRRSVMHTRRTYVRDGRVREIGYEVRMYMPAELRALLVAAGFGDVQLLNPDGEPLTADDRRVIALARAQS